MGGAGPKPSCCSESGARLAYALAHVDESGRRLDGMAAHPGEGVFMLQVIIRRGR